MHSTSALAYEEEVLVLVDFGIKLNQGSAMKHHDFVAEIALEELKTLFAVFIVPEFAVDQWLVLAQHLFAAFENEVFKILNVDFDGFDLLHDFGKQVKLMLRDGIAPALVEVCNAVMDHVAQALHFHVFDFGHHHFELTFLGPQSKLMQPHIGEIVMSADTGERFEILRNGLNCMHNALFAMFGEPSGHDADVGTDVEDQGILRNHGEEMEKISLLFIPP